MTTCAVWLGPAAPLRSIRWVDGALAAAAKLGNATAVAAGNAAWLDLVADRAKCAGLASVGVPTDLQLDYLGWAQVVAAVTRQLEATTILVDEASRPERLPEVGALAELLGAAQLTNVVAVAREGAITEASRVAGRELHTIRVRGPVVIGVRMAGPVVDDFATPVPSSLMKRLDLPALGLDPHVLGHRALPPRTAAQAKKSLDAITDHLSVHRTPRGT